AADSPTKRARDSISHIAVLAIQTSDQRQNHIVYKLRRQRPRVLVANASQVINHKSFRHAVYAEIDTDTAIQVEKRILIRITTLIEPTQRVRPLILVVQSVHRYRLPSGKIHQHIMLLTAGDTPGSPDIQNPYLPL